MSDLCAVYAVAKEAGNVFRLRVSEPQPYRAALALWQNLDNERAFYEALQNLGTSSTLVTAARVPISYFCVRSVDDPDWPNAAPRSRVRDFLGLPITDNHGNYIF